MSSLSSDRATSLIDAYRACYLKPLEDEDIEKYYVDLSGVRSSEDMRSICFKFQCLKQGEFLNPPILFTGHRGCGKSTELKRIQSQLQSDYLVSYLDAVQELDVNDLHYTDLYLLIIKEVEYILRRSGLRFDNRLLENFEDWFKDITKETEDSVESSIGTEGQVKLSSEPVPFIAKLMVKLLAQIKGSHKRKKIIRETLEKSIAKLMEDTNLLLKDGFDKIRRSRFSDCKGFLIIIDNLDRLSVPTAKKLFFDYASQLQGLACNIIYTVPISVLYYPEDWFGFFNDSLHTVPMVNVYNFEREKWHLNHNQQGLESMASLIEHRVQVENIFNSREELLDLAKASGGHVRQIMQLMQEACMIASTRGHNKIMAEDVNYATERLQLRFQPLINPDHYSVLARLCLKKDIKAVTTNKNAQIMLFNTSALEYLSSNSQWHYVNPVVKGINAFQEAIQYAEAEARTISQ